jgi:hypothetical protein
MANVNRPELDEPREHAGFDRRVAMTRSSATQAEA